MLSESSEAPGSNTLCRQVIFRDFFNLRRRWARRPSATRSHQCHTLGCSHLQSDWSLRSCTCRSSEKWVGWVLFDVGAINQSNHLLLPESYWAIVMEMVRF